MIGENLVSHGDSELAVAVMRLALAQLDYERRVWVSAMKLFCNAGLHEDTVELATAVLQHEPAHGAAYHFLARAYMGVGNVLTATHTQRLSEYTFVHDAFRTGASGARKWLTSGRAKVGR